jgi:serine/threonine protein kinase
VAKKTILGVLQDKDANIVGYIQYKSRTVVEVWFSAKSETRPQITPTKHAIHKRIGQSQVIADRITCRMQEISAQIGSLKFVEIDVQSRNPKYQNSINQIKRHLPRKLSLQKARGMNRRSVDANGYERVAFNQTLDELLTDEERLVERAGLYTNLEMLLETYPTPIKLPRLSEGAEITLLGTGAYGMVLKVETIEGVRARKIEISAAQNIVFFKQKEQSAILKAFFDGSLSYGNLASMLAQVIELSPLDVNEFLSFTSKHAEATAREEDRIPRVMNFSDEETVLMALGGVCFPKLFAIDSELHTYDMEFCAGGTLKQALKTAKPMERMRLLIELSKAMAFIFSHNIIHNDLHAENILLRQDGSLVIADPGKIRFVQAGQPGALFTPDLRKNHLLHPNYILNNPMSFEFPGDKYNRSIDTLYNDAWSYVLLLGEILNPEIQLKYYPEQMNQSGLWSMAEHNLAQVNMAIKNSHFLSSNACDMLILNINLLTPKDTKIDSIYTNRQILMDALSVIQTEIECELSILENTQIKAPPVLTLLYNPTLTTMTSSSRSGIAWEIRL